MTWTSRITKDHQLGAIVGALVGDAAGAHLEFHRGSITEELAIKAMNMPGGGVLGLAPGQITDDGELTLALLSSLSKHKANDRFPIKDVANSYVEWLLSDPFDCGRTCRQGFTALKHSQTIHQAMVEIDNVNGHSEANGALMRATPIGVFYHGQRYSVVGAYAKADAKLSHPSNICQDASALYSVAIADLVNYPKDNYGTILQVQEFATHNKVHPTVLQWLDDSKHDLSHIDCSDNIGHVKHAFTLAFHFLRRGTAYEDAIRETLMKAGDTDTNACIVGGLIGALHGFSDIPEVMRETVLDFDCVTHDPWKTLLGCNRPTTYKSMNAYDIVMSL